MWVRQDQHSDPSTLCTQQLQALWWAVVGRHTYACRLPECVCVSLYEPRHTPIGTELQPPFTTNLFVFRACSCVQGLRRGPTRMPDSGWQPNCTRPLARNERVPKGLIQGMFKHHFQRPIGLQCS